MEFVNTSGGDVDMIGWFLLASPSQNTLHARITPWTSTYVIANGQYFVIGETASPPSEMPGGTPYVDLVQNIPWFSDEYDCALYDSYGRLVDLVRTGGHDDQLIHNFPRAPGHWAGFLGYAARDANGDGAIGRDYWSTDTDGGADWTTAAVRTMGAPNPATGTAGRSNAPDARIHETAAPGGLTFIINAGPAYAGGRYALLFSFSHMDGVGPFHGLAADSWGNYLNFNMTSPFGATLDAQGSFRFDFPPGAIPAGFVADHRVLLFDPTGPLVGATRVIEQDH